MWQAQNMDSEPAVDWFGRLQRMVDEGCALRLEQADGDGRQTRYVMLKRWTEGQYAVTARLMVERDPSVLVCESFDDAYAEFREQADELFGEEEW